MVFLPRASQKHFCRQCGKIPIALRFITCHGKKPKCFFLMARTFHGIKRPYKKSFQIILERIKRKEKSLFKTLNRLQFFHKKTVSIRDSQRLAPQVGFEPTAYRLTVECSTTELLGNIKLLFFKRTMVLYNTFKNNATLFINFFKKFLSPVFIILLPTINKTNHILTTNILLPILVLNSGGLYYERK